MMIMIAIFSTTATATTAATVSKYCSTKPPSAVMMTTNAMGIPTSTGELT